MDIKQLISNTGILGGTIQCHRCNPNEECYVCNGSGRCQSCGGSGNVICLKCYGNGICQRCYGQGTVTCTRCHGSGTSILNASDSCNKCYGTGIISCPSCTSVTKKGINIMSIHMINLKGNGRCSECSGSGRVECKTCSGSGLCENCVGTGLVTCRRCEGSGAYQTYDSYTARCKAINYTYVSNENLREGLNKVEGSEIYSGVYKKWKSKDCIEFDNESTLIKNIESKTEDKNQAINFLSVQQSTFYNNASQLPYCYRVDARQVDVLRVDYSLEDQDYSVYLMENGVVVYEDIPKYINLYKASLWKRLKMLLTKKTRQVAYIKLAAYIFQCDGKNIDESKVLNAFINAYKVSDAKKIELKQELLKYDSNYSYEQFRKEIKVLFSSTKTLTFAWQCMSVDKKMTSQEESLFNKLTAEYKKITPEKIEQSKRFADKYTLLQDDQLVKEYVC